MARPRKLDEVKQREICALISVGCDRRSAARYVGCTAETIRLTAKRDRQFAERLDQAEMRHKFQQLQNIHQAGKTSWRAAAWLLERKYPDQFARRDPDSVSHDELARFMTAMGETLAKCVSEHVTEPAVLKAIQRDLTRLARMAERRGVSK
jgi:hypothetical protein